MKIEIDDLTRPAVHALLREHMRSMHALGPPESVHALDLAGLRRPEITFWTAWSGDLLLGCGALLALSATHGEVKSMRTDAAFQGRGVGAQILTYIIEQCRIRGYRRLSLETGSSDHFAAAHRLYRRFGFTPCGPFANYPDDPFSRFYTLDLGVVVGPTR